MKKSIFICVLMLSVLNTSLYAHTCEGTQRIYLSFYPLDVSIIAEARKLGIDVSGFVKDPIQASITKLRKVFYPLPSDETVSRFVFSGLEIEPIEAQRGLLRVRVDVTNVGDREGTIETYLRVDGKRCGLISLTLKPGESNTATFEIERGAGYHEVEVGGLEMGFKVFINQAFPYSKLYASIIIISMVAVAVFLKRRERSRREVENE